MAGKMKLIQSELEFSKWFKQNYKKLGYQKILTKKNGKFPDFLMLKDSKEVGVELETVSSNFLLHKHNIKYVDEVVCIKKDIELGIPVIEAKNLEYRSRIVRVSATVDKETVSILKTLLKEGKYRNISHVIERAVEVLYEAEKNEK